MNKKWDYRGILTLAIIVFVLIFGSIKTIQIIKDSQQMNQDPTSINNMTNKEYNQFTKWKDEQKQQKIDNSKIGTDN